jgi:hypothetical protein
MGLSSVSNRLRGAFASMGPPLLAVLCCTVPGPPPARAQLTHAQLRQIARDAMTDKLVWITNPVIRYDEDAVRFDLGSVEIPEDLREELRPLRFPLRAQFRVEMIRKCQSKPEQQRAWQPYLERVERVIDKELALIDRHGLARWPKREEDGRVQNEFYEKLEGYDAYTDRILVSYLDSVAEGRSQVAIRVGQNATRVPVALDPTPATPPSRSPRRPNAIRGPERPDPMVEIPVEDLSSTAAEVKVHYCTVKILTVPEGASVYYLPEFEYRLREQVGQADDPANWREIAADTVELCGNYRFLARWSSSGKSKRTVKVPITKDENLILRP